MLLATRLTGLRLIMGLAKSCIHALSITVQLPVSRSKTSNASMPESRNMLHVGRGWR